MSARHLRRLEALGNLENIPTPTPKKKGKKNKKTVLPNQKHQIDSLLTKKKPIEKENDFNEKNEQTKQLDEESETIVDNQENEQEYEQEENEQEYEQEENEQEYEQEENEQEYAQEENEQEYDQEENEQEYDQEYEGDDTIISDQHIFCYEQREDEEEDETDQEEKSEEKSEKTSTQKKGKKKNKKKGGQGQKNLIQKLSKAPNTKKKKKKNDEEDWDFDNVQITPSPKPKNEPKINPTQKLQQLLCCEVKYLDSEYELRKLFGDKIIDQERGYSQNNTKKKAIKKKTVLIRKRNEWPPVTSVVQMNFIGSKDGFNHFTIVWPHNYTLTQEMFKACVESYDPATLFELLRHHPFQVDCLMQTSSLLRSDGQHEKSLELIEKVIYFFEHCWHHLFSPTRGPNSGTCCLSYIACPEARPFFVAIFSYIQILSRQGSHRTALEYCKFILSMDMSDPLFLLSSIDSLALKSGEYNFLIDFVERFPLLQTSFFSSLPTTVSQQFNNFTSTTTTSSAPVQATPLSSGVQNRSSITPTSKGSYVPPKENILLYLNFSFSYALAHWFLPEHKEKSKDILIRAIIRYPHLILRVLYKNGITSLTVKEKLGDGVEVTVDAFSFPFFLDSAVVPDNLHNFTCLFVEKNCHLWKNPEIVGWVRECIQEVVRLVQSGSTLIEELKSEVKELYKELSYRMYNNLYLSENVEGLKLPSSIKQNASLYPNGPPPVSRAPTNNPLLLFFHTLMPWNQMPEAPALNDNNNN